MNALRKLVQQRAVFVGCQICGETNLPLKRYAAGKLCPRCAARVSKSDTERRGEDDQTGKRIH